MIRIGNYKEITEQNEAVKEEDRLKVQQKLLKKVASVKSDYSHFLFLVEHINTWEQYNCEGKCEFS